MGRDCEAPIAASRSCFTDRAAAAVAVAAPRKGSLRACHIPVRCTRRSDEARRQAEAEHTLLLFCWRKYLKVYVKGRFSSVFGRENCWLGQIPRVPPPAEPLPPPPSRQNRQNAQARPEHRPRFPLVASLSFRPPGQRLPWPPSKLRLPGRLLRVQRSRRPLPRQAQSTPTARQGSAWKLGCWMPSACAWACWLRCGRR